MCYNYDTKSRQIEAWRLFAKSELIWITWKVLFLNFLWHVLDLLWLSIRPDFKIHQEMGFLSPSEPVRAWRLQDLVPHVTAKMKTSYQRHAVMCLDNMVLILGGSLGRQRDHSRENGRKKVGKLSFLGARMNKRGWRGSRRGAGWNHKAHQPREEAGDNPRRVQTQQILKSKTKLSWNICP